MATTTNTVAVPMREQEKPKVIFVDDNTVFKLCWVVSGKPEWQKSNDRQFPLVITPHNAEEMER